jgi:hypothetical protein
MRLLLVALLLCAPQLAFANAGIPMLALAWPAQWLGFIPIVFLEAYLAHRWLAIPMAEALKVTALANALSTVFGVPIAWACMLILEMVVGLGMSSLININTEPFSYLLFPFMVAWIATENVWVVYLAFVILAVPFCYASIVIERYVAARRLPAVPTANTNAWALKANVASYTLLIVTSAIYPLWFANHAA